MPNYAYRGEDGKYHWDYRAKPPPEGVERSRQYEGSGHQYCGALHTGLRDNSVRKLTEGYFLITVGTGALAVAPAIAATDGAGGTETGLSDAEKVASIVSPIVGGLLLWGAAQAFQDSSHASRAVERMRDLSPDEDVAADQCNEIVSDWAGDRVHLATAGTGRTGQ